MTVIAWDGHTLAADKLSRCGNTKNRVTKIYAVGELLFAGAGEFAFILECLEWVRKGRAPDAFPPAQRNKDDWQPFFVIEANKIISTYERTPVPIVVEDEFYTLGSGGEYALAALHLGLNAVQAVELASRLDPASGFGIDTLQLGVV